MGNYREQYENYYGNMGKGTSRASYKRIGSSQGSFNGNTKSNKTFGQKLITQFIWQLIGAFILLLIIMVSKYIPIENADVVYSTAKEKVDEELNFDDVLETMNISDVSEFKEEALDCIDQVKSSVTGEKTAKQIIRDEYVLPVTGKVEDLTDELNAVALITDEESDVLASYDGTVSEVTDNDEDKNITIDHGNGVMTYYGVLSNVQVSLGDTVAKGQCIGRTGEIDSEGTKGVIYRFIYMGDEKSPSDMIDLSSLEKV